LSMFCPKCGFLMFPEEGKLVCKKCSHAMNAKTDKVHMGDVEDTETLFTDDNLDTLPITTVRCEKCGNNKAAYQMRQTRAADEPTTRIYRCTKCKHTWREF